jgi:hypothetical protein
MRILAALTGLGASTLGGIVEADEKFFRESRKGSREWVNHERDPACFPRPDRPRWRDYHRLGLKRPAGISKYQIPVLTVTDRASARRADVLPDPRAESLVARLDAHVGRDAVLCSDGDGAYDVFARARAMPHYRLPKHGPQQHLRRDRRPPGPGRVERLKLPAQRIQRLVDDRTDRAQRMIRPDPRLHIDVGKELARATIRAYPALDHLPRPSPLCQHRPAR